tara:strand:- start:517 stop:1104 length:588 start_codon:yes stop_codon:yes gene_type:complete
MLQTSPTSQPVNPKTTGNRTHVEYNIGDNTKITVKSVHNVKFQGYGDGKFKITIQKDTSDGNTTPRVVSPLQTPPPPPVLKPKTTDRDLSPLNLNNKFDAVADKTDAVADKTDVVADKVQSEPIQCAGISGQGTYRCSNMIRMLDNGMCEISRPKDPKKKPWMKDRIAIDGRLFCCQTHKRLYAFESWKGSKLAW